MNKKNITIALFGLVIILAGYFFVVAYLYPVMSERGQFGDMFGALNALFSGLALLGVVYAIFLQKEELSMQRKELELTREELKRTAKAQEKSGEELSKQAASLKVTAKLNGKSAILQHYNTLIEMTNTDRYGVNVYEFQARKKDADSIIEEINKLIENK